MQMNSFTGKSILSFLRKGDYAHAGEEEAILRVLRIFPKDGKRLILDVGCGIGGTAKFIQDQNWGKVTGIDIDEESINYAKTTYPDIEFHVCDAVKIDTLFSTSRKFDLICLFNVLYAIKDQAAVLKALWNVANPNARLVIFDYISLNKKKPGIVIHLDKNTNTVDTDKTDFFTIASKAHWKVDEMHEIDEEYKRWYKDLLNKIADNKEEMRQRFGEDSFLTIEKTYSDIYNVLKKKTLGGAIIYATAVGAVEMGHLSL